ncbi:bifunctional aminoglycoside phosphotransferase/ATP-binding protein [Oceanibaculum indicum]|uniref:Aminoglycoside phosphotransferase domain-containing protein n=1 Tax=Oceanibaculum indicum P24 TaxID=1207063 RepID=K2JW41_9PROT|nr:bifunctional aminoglycoside phosphotransferase/ATP-binding protein [Oceanibaculum indicum]EKE78787.1 hypothetical protein P24_00510 [Oceanibaculum indicum P24]
MTGDPQQPVIDFLSRPETYGGPGPVERLETHTAHVFLAGERAYKLKKAVHFPYMDFSTVEKRRSFCEAELALNRRTAPDLYLTVQAVRRLPDGTLTLGQEEGEALDWLVVMRRFDQSALFDTMAERGDLTEPLMDGLADAIAGFHAAAETAPGQGGAKAFRGYVEGNAAELERAIGTVFDASAVERVNQGCRAALKRVTGVLDDRRDGGHVRRCHGDLHLRNICLIDGRPTLFDCIEFNDDFALIDTLYDLSFLLMDLNYRGLRGHANRVLNRYLSRCGYDGLAVLPLMLACRAAIRAHVTARLVDGLEGEKREKAAAEARSYLDLALSYLDPSPARLVAVGGLSGTGKSTLARGLAPALGVAPGAVILRSDVIRKRLFGVAETDPLPQEAYRPEVSRRVFAEIARLAGEVLAQGHAVIADAVYGEDWQRDGIANVAAKAGVPFEGLWLEAPQRLLEERVDNRRGDASDATSTVVRAQAARIRPPEGWRRIDTGGGKEASLAAARDALGLPEIN